jgi:hypothetical protein
VVEQPIRNRAPSFYPFCFQKAAGLRLPGVGGPCATGMAQHFAAVDLDYAVAATGRAAITASVNSCVVALPPRSRVACLPSL